MSFMLTAEQAMVRDSARQAASAISVRAARDLLTPGSTAAYSGEALRQAAELGLGGILVPEEAGGVSLDVVTAALVARELGRKLVASPLLGVSVAAATLAGFAAPGLAGEWLPRLASGDAIVGLALDGHDRPGVRLAAGGRLDGRANWAVDAADADALLVAAATPAGPTLALVPTGLEGVSRETRRMADGRMLASVTFEDVALADDALLGAGALEAAFRLACVWVAANTCGMVEESFERTVEYLRQRRQFDRSLASFQALQHTLAAMLCDVEDAWSATQRAAIAIDEGDPRASFHAAVAKAKTSDVASAAVAECLQLHGGIGMTEEHDIGLYLKAARLSSELLGGYAYHADKVASELGY